MNGVLLREKLIDRRFDVDLVCDEIDRLTEMDGMWRVINYQDILSSVIAHIDSVGGSYGNVGAEPA